MPFIIVRQDITAIKADAIVNAANTELLMGGGVCGAIFRAAGAAELQAACRELAPIRTGEAVLTPGFGLPAKYVIHAAGPVYHDWPPEESRRLLYSAYTESLKLAAAHRCRSIAFPLISGGIYGYPKEGALETAVAAIRAFLEENDGMTVYLAIYDKSSFAVSGAVLQELEAYLAGHCVPEDSRPQRLRQERLRDGAAAPSAVGGVLCSGGLEEHIQSMEEPFSTALLHLIDAKGLTDAEVYKKANLDRRLFSKIRNAQEGYVPAKRTALALAVALELSLEETEDLLKRAGYTLSASRKFDVIIEYFIGRGEYDIYKINEVLFRYDQPLLGAG